MSSDTNHVADDDQLDTLPIECVRQKRIGLMNLPNEIFLLMCRYLSPYHVLYSFFTPKQPELHFHRVIVDYYTKINLDAMKNIEYFYLSNLTCSEKNPHQIESLTLSNQHINYIISRYLNARTALTTQTIFGHLTRLILIDCSSEDVTKLNIHSTCMPQLKYLSITFCKLDEDDDTHSLETYSLLISYLLFDDQVPSIDTVCIKTNDGLALSKMFLPNQNFRNVNLVLQTIDDLYILLDGCIPNVETMIIQLCHARILDCSPPRSTLSCPRLSQFTLREDGIGFVMDDIRSILPYMPTLFKLTLSIRDTPDQMFGVGHILESILNAYLPHLRQFDYTMTHRIGNRTLMEDFRQWPMNIVYYENENVKWIHVYSLPWPSSKDDQRRLPLVKGLFNPSIRSDVKRTEHIEHVLITNQEEFLLLDSQFRRVRQITTCLPIDIKLPFHISKLILSEETSISNMSSIIQSSIRYLTVQHRLNDAADVATLAHLFPKVQYLDLLFPLNPSSFIICLQSLLSRDDNIETKRRFWPELIYFSTPAVYEQHRGMFAGNRLYHWLIQYTDLKYHPSCFYVNRRSDISIWL